MYLALLSFVLNNNIIIRKLEEILPDIINILLKPIPSKSSETKGFQVVSNFCECRYLS